MGERFSLVDGYDRRKHKARHVYRSMSTDEARALRYGDEVEFLATDGTVRRCKVNGAPRTWKRDPKRVEVPVKYGMYEYTRLVARADGTMERLLVRLAGCSCAPCPACANIGADGCDHHNADRCEA